MSTSRCKDPANVAGGVASQSHLSCFTEEGKLLMYDNWNWADFAAHAGYHALHLKNAVYLTALFFIISEGMQHLVHFINCRLKDILVAFSTVSVAWFVILSVLSDCGFHQELGYKLVSSLEFSATILLAGFGIYSVLTLLEFVSNNDWKTCANVFIIVVVVMYCLIMCFGDLYNSATDWDRNPIPLFKDLK